MKLQTAIDMFLSTYDLRSPKTKTGYSESLRLFVTWADDPELEDVTPEMLDRYASSLTRRLKHSSRYRYMQILKTLFSWCVKRGHLEVSPAVLATGLHQPVSIVVGFTPTEVKELIVATAQLTGVYQLRARALVILMIGTGARASEAIALQQSHIDWDAGRIRLQGKGDKERVVPMGRIVRESLYSYIVSRPEDSPTVFVTNQSKPMSYGAMRLIMVTLGELSGIPGCHLHKLRHTYASQWFREHPDLIALRNLLGHSDVKTTEGYLRSLGESYGAEFSTPDEWLTV